MLESFLLHYLRTTESELTVTGKDARNMYNWIQVNPTDFIKGFSKETATITHNSHPQPRSLFLILSVGHFLFPKSIARLFGLTMFVMTASVSVISPSGTVIIGRNQSYLCLHQDSVISNDESILKDTSNITSYKQLSCWVRQQTVPKALS